MNSKVSGIIDDQVAWFERNMVRIAGRLQTRITNLMYDFDITSGVVQNSGKNLLLLRGIYTSIIDELQIAGYNNMIQALTDKENDLLRALKSSAPAGSVPLAFTETTQASINAFNSLWNARIGSLSTDVARQVHSLVGDSIFSWLSVDSVVAEVRAILEDKLVRYATTYVNTSRAKFIQLALYDSARNYEGGLFWVYEGPQDDVTRPVCREGTGMDTNGSFPNAPYFTESERIEFEAYSGAERQYNCRHSFMQITKEYYDEHVR